MSRRPTGVVVRDVSKKTASGPSAEGSHWNMFSRPSTTVPPSRAVTQWRPIEKNRRPLQSTTHQPPMGSDQPAFAVVFGCAKEPGGLRFSTRSPCSEFVAVCQGGAELQLGL